MSEWTRVENELPANSDTYLVYCNGQIRESFFTKDKRFALTVLYGVKISHWMPRPAPPTN